MERFINDILLRTGQIGKQEYINEMTKKESDGEYPCNMCGKSFKNKKEYDMHKDGRNSKKSYYCKAMREDFQEFEEELVEGSIERITSGVENLEAKKMERNLTDKEEKQLAFFKKGLTAAKFNASVKQLKQIKKLIGQINKMTKDFKVEGFEYDDEILEGKKKKPSDGGSEKKMYAKDTESDDIEDEDDEKSSDDDSEGDSKEESGGEVAKLKKQIKKLKAEIKELKGGGKKKDKKKDDGDSEDYDGDGESDDDEMAKLRAMKK